MQVQDIKFFVQRVEKQCRWMKNRHKYPPAGFTREYSCQLMDLYQRVARDLFTTVDQVMLARTCGSRELRPALQNEFYKFQNWVGANLDMKVASPGDV